MLIDVHTHVLPEGFLDLLRSGEGPADTKISVRKGREFAVHDNGLMYPLLPVFFDPDAKLSQMDEDGIDVSVISPSPTLFYYWETPAASAEIAQLVNDGIAALAAAGGGRLFGMASIPMNNPESAVTELRRAREELGLVGAAIGPSVGDIMLDDDRFDPFFRACAELAMPVMLHPYVGMMGSPPPSFEGYHLNNVICNPLETFVAAARLIVGGVLDKAPDLIVQLSHGGGSFPYQLGRLEHAYRVRSETSAVVARPPTSYLTQFLFDTVIYERSALDFLIGYVGPDKVLYGTDVPFDMTDLATGRMSGSASADVVEAVSWRNAVRAYQLPIGD